MHRGHHRMFFPRITDHLQQHLSAKICFAFQTASVVDRPTEEQGT